ncbi:MAG: biotin--[acetyl-CoA-carboxylase] ligase [Prevotella sp.]|nr:biotin--[acetyl-CoA-carboxylase] ligase [Prevotella sp.]
MEAKLIHLDEVDSTNRYLRDYQPAEGELATICVADFQTAGRGCGTNRWESERGQNLLCSLLIHPNDIPAAQQFHISMAIALAICDALNEFGVKELSVKWPNDIYWRDRKLCGILIENTLAGSIIRNSIIGIGLNVNQREFHSDAPNPVSLRQILGHDADPMEILHAITRHLNISPCSIDFTRLCYNAKLYWRDGKLHPFRDAQGPFMAEIEEVTNDGTLFLRRDDEKGLTSYAFKEVEHEITKQL